MLELLRNGVRSWYFKALLGMLVLSFAIWGVGDIFRGGPRTGAVIEVGDTAITAREIGENFRKQLNALTRTFGSDISVEQARQLGVGQRVVASLVTEALYDSETATLGVAVADELVADRIRKERGFQDKSGNFDRAVYEQTLAVNGLNEKQFVARLRHELGREQILGSLTAGIPTSEQLAERLYEWREEKRVADFVRINNDPAADAGEPDEAALIAYHKENEQIFTAPEYRDATYIHLSSADVLNDVAVSDSEIKELYESRIDQFHIPERRTLQQMVFPTEEAAKDAVNQLSEGKDFVALAKVLLKQDEAATNLGDVTRSRLPDALADPVFALSPGQTSAPLKGPFGWHVMRVTGSKPESVKPLEEVRDTLRKELAEEKSIEVLYELANQLEDALGGGATLEEAASGVGVSVRKAATFDRRGYGTDEKPVESLPTEQEFLETVFNTPTGEVSHLVELGTHGYLIVRVDGITPSAVRPLETVREKVVRAWKAEQRQKLTAEKAEAALKRITGGTPLATVAKELGVKIETTSPFNREGEGAESTMPRELAADMFAGKIGDAALAPFGAGRMIAVLKEIRPVNPKVDKAAMDALRQHLAQGIANDLEVQYNNALRQLHTVKIDEQAVEAVFNQF